MIGKPQWFKRRKYLGWGLMPVTWQGWLYSIILVAITIILINLPVEISLKIAIISIWAIFILIEFGSMMVRINDEREKVHEAIAERNALWAVIIVATVGIGYQVASSSIKGSYAGIDWFLVAAIGTALIVKAISNIWLERKN